MASNVAARPLVSIAIPESGAARLALRFFPALGGSLPPWLSPRRLAAAQIFFQAEN